MGKETLEFACLASGNLVGIRILGMSNLGLFLYSTSFVHRRGARVCSLALVADEGGATLGASRRGIGENRLQRRARLCAGSKGIFVVNVRAIRGIRKVIHLVLDCSDRLACNIHRLSGHRSYHISKLFQAISETRDRNKALEPALFIRHGLFVWVLRNLMGVVGRDAFGEFNFVFFDGLGLVLFSLSFHLLDVCLLAALYEEGLGLLKSCSQVVAFFDLFREVLVVPVDPNILQSIGKGVVKFDKLLDSQPLSWDAGDEYGGGAGSDTVLRTGEVFLAQADVDSEFPIKHVAASYDEVDGHK